MGMGVHVVSVMVIVVPWADRVVVVIVGHNHSTVLTGRWAIVAWITIGIVAIPHVYSLLVGARVAPGGCSIINLHLSANGGRGGLFPASGLHALVLFADIAPARGILFHRTRTTPRTNAAPSSTASAAAAAAFLGLGRAPASLHWAIGT